MSGPPRPRISRATGVEFQLKRVTGMESQHMRATKCALPRKAMGARSQLIVWGSPHQCVQIAGLPDPVGPRVLDFLGAYNLFSVYISPFGMRCPIPFPALYFIFFLFLFIYLNFILFFKLYIIVLVLPNIKMNPPQVYMCSPS